MLQAWYSSLFGGMPPTNTFLGGASLLGGNLVSSVVTNTGYSPYVGATTQVSPSYPHAYNPGGTLLGGKNPFTSHSSL